MQKVEAHKRELRMLQQEQQVSIARAREEVRETKNHEISEIWAKSDQVGRNLGDGHVTSAQIKLTKLMSLRMCVCV